MNEYTVSAHVMFLDNFKLLFYMV